jgi:hypothetical protein
MVESIKPTTEFAVEASAPAIAAPDSGADVFKPGRTGTGTARRSRSRLVGPAECRRLKEGPAAVPRPMPKAENPPNAEGSNSGFRGMLRVEAPG